MKRPKCKCPVYCKYCGRKRSLDAIGHYCKTKNCQWEHGYSTCVISETIEEDINWKHDKDCEFKTDPEKGICYCEERANENLVQKVTQWVRSPNGRKALKESMEQADAAIKDLQEKRKVDPETLNKPMTI